MGLLKMPIHRAQPELLWVAPGCCGARIEVEAAAGKVDGDLEVRAAAIAARQTLYLLHLRIHGLLQGVGDAVPQVGQDVGEPSLQGPRHRDQWRQTTVGDPEIPAAEETTGPALAVIGPELSQILHQGPGAADLQVQAPNLPESGPQDLGHPVGVVEPEIFGPREHCGESG